MTQQRNYVTRGITILLAILALFSIVPVVSADDDYLDGGYMGMPTWLYARLNPAVMNNIIGVVHGHTFFSPSEGNPANTGHSFIRDTDFSPRIKFGLIF